MSLLKKQAYIAGSWCDAAGGDKFEIVNPADASVVAEVPDMGIHEARTSISAASEALDGWRNLSCRERSDLLKAWRDLVIENVDEMALIMTLEQGKGIRDSKLEVLASASTIEWVAEEAVRLYGKFYPSHKNDARAVVMKQPIGVVAAITPWNFPSLMVVKKIAPAIAAGCTIVLKPAQDTPLSALALVALAEKAGIPEGVINIITCSAEKAEAVGKIFTSDKRVRKITFTGSTRVGKILLEQSAADIKKISLELGGNAPFIVFDDADVDRAVAAAVDSRFRNSGQTCICANRIYVHKSIYRQFCVKYTEATKLLKMGNGIDVNIDMGPLINKDAIEKAKKFVSDALSKGGNLVLGGKVHKAGELFFEPTVIIDANDDMLMASEEIFSPIAAIYEFTTDDEVVRRANNTQYGLASYIYTKSMKRSWLISEQLEYGMVGVNEYFISNSLTPFGGIKHSGMGREGSYMALDDFTEVKYVLMGDIR